MNQESRKGGEGKKPVGGRLSMYGNSNLDCCIIPSSRREEEGDDVQGREHSSCRSAYGRLTHKLTELGTIET